MTRDTSWHHAIAMSQIMSYCHQHSNKAVWLWRRVTNFSWVRWTSLSLTLPPITRPQTRLTLPTRPCSKYRETLGKSGLRVPNSTLTECIYAIHSHPQSQRDARPNSTDWLSESLEPVWASKRQKAKAKSARKRLEHCPISGCLRVQFKGSQALILHCDTCENSDILTICSVYTDDNVLRIHW